MVAGADDYHARLGTSETSCRFLSLGYQDSHRVIEGGRDDPAIFDISVSLDTVSKADVKSIATHMLRGGGFGWLKPISMSVVSWMRIDIFVPGSETMLILS